MTDALGKEEESRSAHTTAVLVFLDPVPKAHLPEFLIRARFSVIGCCQLFVGHLLRIFHASHGSLVEPFVLCKVGSKDLTKLDIV